MTGILVRIIETKNEVFMDKRLYEVFDRLIDLLEATEKDMANTNTVSLEVILSANTARQKIANLENIFSVDLKQFISENLKVRVVKKEKLN